MQHVVSAEVDGVVFSGSYTLERQGRWDQLTVWYRGRSLTENKIAHEADEWSTEAIAESLLRKLVETTET